MLRKFRRRSSEHVELNRDQISGEHDTSLEHHEILEIEQAANNVPIN